MLKKYYFSLNFCVLSLILASMLLLGCADDANSPKEVKRERPLVGVLLYRADDTYISFVSNVLKEYFEKADVEILMYDGANKQLTQDEQLRLTLEAQVDALVVNLVDVQSASFIVDEIKKMNIPVVFFNREPSLDDLKVYERASFVGTTPEDAGYLQGEIIAQLWSKHPEMDRNKDGIVQYIMIQANSDNPESLARTEYSVRHARECGVPMEQAGNTFLSGWDEERSYRALRSVLPQFLDSFELIIANNDAMALGAIRALQENGYNTGEKTADKYIPVVGVDATPRAMQAIEAGFMAGTVKQNSDLMGKTIVALVMNALANKPPLEGIGLEWDTSGIALRIPYATVESVE